MPGMNFIILLVIIAVVALFAVAFGKRGEAGYSFTGCPLMSESEIRFYRVLQMAVPNELVLPQVGMAAVSYTHLFLAIFAISGKMSRISMAVIVAVFASAVGVWGRHCGLRLRLWRPDQTPVKYEW